MSQHPVAAAATPGLEWFRAGTLAPVVGIEDDGTLGAALRAIMVGWRLTPLPGGPSPEAAAPRLVVRPVEGGWRCSGDGFAQPVTYRDAATTACALFAALYKAHTLVDDRALVLHAAGVRVGPGVVLVTGHYRAGKTVFSAAAAASGLEVFSDDIIELGPDGKCARAPGLAIRVRLPLPDALAPATRATIEGWEVLAGERYAYLRPPAGRLAPRGAEAPVAGIVTLRRSEDPGMPARLLRLSPGDALAEAIRRNFARETPAGMILERMDALIARVPCFALHYARPEEAVTLLAETMTGRRPMPEAAVERPAGAAAGRRVRPLAADVRVVRVPGIRVRERGGRAFLVDPDETTIFGLNATGTALWRLLERPIAFGEILDLFSAAFPDQPRALLAGDLTRLLRDLALDGLVRIEGDADAG